MLSLFPAGACKLVSCLSHRSLSQRQFVLCYFPKEPGLYSLRSLTAHAKLIFRGGACFGDSSSQVTQNSSGGGDLSPNSTEILLAAATISPEIVLETYFDIPVTELG